MSDLNVDASLNCNPGLKVSCLELIKLMLPASSAFQRIQLSVRMCTLPDPNIQCDQAMCMSVVAKPNQSCLDHNCTRSAHALAQSTIIVVPGQAHLHNFSMVLRTVVCNS